MPPPTRSRPLRKNDFPTIFKPLKPILYSDHLGPRAPTLIPRINSLSWSATGSLIATCTSANIRVWNIERPNAKSSTEIRNAHVKGGGEWGAGGVGGAPAAPGSVAGELVEKVAFCPTSENVLASVGQDGMVRVWDVRTPSGPGSVVALGQEKISGGGSRSGSEGGSFLAWHPSGLEMLVASGGGAAVHAVDMRRGADLDGTLKMALDARECTPHSGDSVSNGGSTSNKPAYYNMSFSNSGREVFASTYDGGIQILDYPSMTLLHTLQGHAAQTYTAQQSPTGGYVAAGSADGMITLWETATWFCAGTLTAHTGSVRDVSWSFDGAYVVAGSGSDARDGSAGLQIYHADTGEVVYTVDTANPVSYAAWHPTRYFVAYAGDPGGLKVVGAGGMV